MTTHSFEGPYQGCTTCDLPRESSRHDVESDTHRYFHVVFRTPDGDVRRTESVYGPDGLDIARGDVLNLLTVRGMISASIVSEMP